MRERERDNFENVRDELSCEIKKKWGNKGSTTENKIIPKFEGFLLLLRLFYFYLLANFCIFRSSFFSFNSSLLLVYFLCFLFLFFLVFFLFYGQIFRSIGGCVVCGPPIPLTIENISVHSSLFHSTVGRI